ncbi:peroxisome biogenesis factor 2-like [Styela clava]
MTKCFDNMTAEQPKQPSIPCMRVTQLDAQDLDEYLSDLLMRQQLDKCIKFLFPEKLSKIKPELQTALYSLLMCSTVGRFHQTVGQKLFGVMMANSCDLSVAPNKKISSLIILEIFLYWWKTRYRDNHPTMISKYPRISKLLDILISCMKVLDIINILRFLRTGEYNRLLLRILGLRIVFDHPNPVPSSISYTILSRDILWRGFAETSMYFLTLFDIPRLKKFFRRYFQPLYEEGNLATQPDLQVCGICEDWPTQPYETACGHVFCYYCASTAISSKSKCVLCDSIMDNTIGPKIVN